MAPLAKVAVIGAGVSGLATACELQRAAVREIVLFEKACQIGGTWVYTPEVEEDPLGLDPNRKIVHSSLYRSLRTNLSRRLMGFSHYPFPDSRNGCLTNFPSHEEVLKFLNDFAIDFGLMKLVRFNTEVVRIEQVSSEDDRWVVESKTSDQLNTSEELFDAVVICNGHNTQPRLAELPGIENWPGKQIHSHNYRVPEPFQDQVVVVIGFGPSAFEIATEVAKAAKEVHLSSRSPSFEVTESQLENVWLHSEIDFCQENGEVAFMDGASVLADVIMHCTGYCYHLPFLRTNGVVSIEDNRVGPLYKHVFPPQLAPRLSFVGIPRQSVNFPMIELQAKWVARVLSGKVLLPSKEEMLADVEQHYKLLKQNGVPKHHTHSLVRPYKFVKEPGVPSPTPPPNKFEYLDWLAAQVGLPAVDEGKRETLETIIKCFRTSPAGFRELADRIVQ